MPVSDVANQTVSGRYATYTPEFRRETGIGDIRKFVAEMDAGKEYLKATNNKLFEHSILCMWRVVLFSEHCIVQNYFPNPEGEYSFTAPTFVFRRHIGAAGVEEKNSYYSTFAQMFDLVLAFATPILPASN